jgi:glycosyltransferase involved in cell wall biosynthesis
MPTARIVVVLPAYNEERTIAQVIEQFHVNLPEARIVVVDNNSSDRTRELAEAAIRRLRANAEILFESTQGKAFAVRRAFCEIEADIFVLCDADLTYPADEIQALLKPIREGRADMVVGDRHSTGGYKAENKRPMHGFGNSLVRWLINTLFRSNLHDILSGYRVYNRRFIKNYPILSRGFDIEAEMTLHALDKGFRIMEVPICYKDRPEGSFSKLNTYRDGVRVLALIMEIFRNYRPLAFFGSLALLFLAAGAAAGIPVLQEFLRIRYITHVPLAILATGLMTISFLAISIGLILDTVTAHTQFRYALRLLDSDANQRPAAAEAAAASGR